MKPEDVNVAIAEACGFDMSRVGKDIYICPTCIREVDANHGHTHQVFIKRIKIPNYYEDLNAIHEAEKVLTHRKWSSYCVELEAISRTYPAYNQWRELNPSRVIDVCLIHATAPQRCEAFLRTLGKWVETKGEGE